MDKDSLSATIKLIQQKKQVSVLSLFFEQLNEKPNTPSKAAPSSPTFKRVAPTTYEDKSGTGKDPETDEEDDSEEENEDPTQTLERTKRKLKRANDTIASLVENITKYKLVIEEEKSVLADELLNQRRRTQELEEEVKTLTDDLLETVKEYERKIQEIKEEKRTYQKETMDNLQTLFQEMSFIEEKNEMLNKQLEEDARERQMYKDLIAQYEAKVKRLEEENEIMLKARNSKMQRKLNTENELKELRDSKFTLSDDSSSLKKSYLILLEEYQKEKNKLTDIKHLAEQIRILAEGNVNQSEESAAEVKPNERSTVHKQRVQTLRNATLRRHSNADKDDTPHPLQYSSSEGQVSRRELPRSFSVLKAKEIIQRHTASKPPKKSDSLKTLTSLPEGWECNVGEDGKISYINKRTGEETFIHPVFSLAREPASQNSKDIQTEDSRTAGIHSNSDKTVPSISVTAPASNPTTPLKASSPVNKDDTHSDKSSPIPSVSKATGSLLTPDTGKSPESDKEFKKSTSNSINNLNSINNSSSTSLSTSTSEKEAKKSNPNSLSKSSPAKQLLTSSSSSKKKKLTDSKKKSKDEVQQENTNSQTRESRSPSAPPEVPKIEKQGRRKSSIFGWKRP